MTNLFQAVLEDTNVAGAIHRIRDRVLYGKGVSGPDDLDPAITSLICTVLKVSEFHRTYLPEMSFEGFILDADGCPQDEDFFDKDRPKNP